MYCLCSSYSSHSVIKPRIGFFINLTIVHFDCCILTWLFDCFAFWLDFCDWVWGACILWSDCPTLCDRKEWGPAFATSLDCKCETTFPCLVGKSSKGSFVSLKLWRNWILFMNLMHCKKKFLLLIRQIWTYKEEKWTQTCHSPIVFKSVFDKVLRT